MSENSERQDTRKPEYRIIRIIDVLIFLNDLIYLIDLSSPSFSDKINL